MYGGKRQGVILSTSSMVSIFGQPSGFAYPASKFAVNGLTVSLLSATAVFKGWDESLEFIGFLGRKCRIYTLFTPLEDRIGI